MASSPFADVDTFAAAVREGDPAPTGLAPALQVLWLAAAGQWDAAHDLAQAMPDPDGARLHAYLHRVEGDLGNAAYWYRRAGEEPLAASLADEWRALAARFLAGG